MARGGIESSPGAGECLSAKEREALVRMLPHRYPFLLVDRVLECQVGKRIVALKNVSNNEPFFVGHFPGDPVMPGVLICEALAQAGALLAFRTDGGAPPNGRLLLAGLESTRFRRPVLPGDQLRLEVESIRRHGRVWKMKGVAAVEGAVVAETCFSVLAAEESATVEIHPTAVVGRGVELGEGVTIGPYAVIEGAITIGKQTRIGPHVVIQGRTKIGERNSIFQFASIGSKPQDLKYKDEPSRLEIGDENQIREYVTMNPGTSGGGMVTRVGSKSLFMMGSHVAHDCFIGDHVIMANSSALAGHVTLEDYVIVGGLAAVHQFVRVGESAMLGGGAMVNLDVPPYCSAWGDRAKLRGLNLVGLKRRGFTSGQIRRLKEAYELLFLSGRCFAEALKSAQERLGDSAEVAHLLSFVSSSKRGIAPAARGGSDRDAAGD